jgi:DNA-binding CsgD family transcriptional regulator
VGEAAQPAHHGIIGRERELRSLRAFFDGTAGGPTALVLEGEAGIGKSTLWLAAVSIGRERGWLVLTSRPAEAEQGFDHVGLADLFEGVLDRVGPSLSPPRRRALEVALAVGDPGPGADARTLAVAVRDSLELLAADGPVAVAIDDVQWLDRSSAAALAFALRRIQNERVVVLLARRLARGGGPSPLEHAVDADRVERIEVAPLSLGALHEVLRARLGRTFARPALLRIHEVSGGNPFYALELARVLEADVDPTRPLPVPESLDELLRGRLDGLPGETRRALSLVAASGHPSRRLLAAAGVTESALEPAFDARVIEHAADTVSFTHPLLASVHYQALPPAERRRTHEVLAKSLDDPVGRARHLALASDGPDRSVAGALDHAHAVAAARGAPVVAAELCELAIRFTADDDRGDRERRLLESARAHLTSGDLRRARARAEELLATSRDGGARGEALVLLSKVADASGGVERSVALLRDALGEASAHPRLLAAIHRTLGDLLRLTEGLEIAEQHALASLELAESLEDDALRAGALSTLALLRFNAGEPGAVHLAEEAYALAKTTGDHELRLQAALDLGHVLMWSAQHEQGRALLEGLHREVRDHDERASHSALWYLSLLELQAGRWSVAADHIGRAREIVRLYAVDAEEDAANFTAAGRIAVQRGELAQARDFAERGREVANTQVAFIAPLEGILGFAELWSGDPAAAVERFEAAERAAASVEIREPTIYWWRAEFVEALLELGRADDAVELLDAWEAAAARVDRDWVLAQVTRCRGLVAAARNDVDGAVATLEAAVAQHKAVGDPFGRARALLALGVARRRRRQKSTAREAIDAALAAFEELGARTWTEQARAEQARIGGRTRDRGLSPAERRVARLVAAGRTNREVAAELFLGERTVESHLTRIYAKLGVRSRTELARTLDPYS